MNIANLIKTSAVVLLLAATFLSAPADAQRRGKVAKAEPLYPNATRVEPKIKPVPKLQRDLSKISKAYDDDKYDEIPALAEAILANKAAGPYERALANQFLGVALSDKDDYPGAITAFKKAIDENILGNDQHYQLMYQVAQMMVQESQYDDALAMLDRFMAETKADKPEASLLKAHILYEQEKYAEAVPPLKHAIATSDKPQENWYQLLIQLYVEQEKYDDAIAVARELADKNPNDVKYQTNLAAVLVDAERNLEAANVLEAARAKGLLNDERGYRQLYALYYNLDGQENKVVEVINEGLAKNILKPTVEVYSILAQTYYNQDKIDQAIETYRKAGSVATDGESTLNLARLLSNEARFAEAKAAAKEALGKGLKRPGDAWVVIGRAEHGLGNKAGVVAAYKEAAKYPETAQSANEWLKKNGAK